MSRIPIPRARGSALLGVLLAALALAAGAQASPSLPIGDGVGGVGLTKLGTLHQPTYSAIAPGRANRNRLFVVERSGTVRIIRGKRLLRRPFLDITDRVDSDVTEQGLLSIAFDPDYVDNRRFYVYYTAADGAITVERYKRARGKLHANPRSGRTVISIPHGFASNHDGGQVSFGPDGNMWIGTGDGGGACDPQGNGQDTGTLLGKLLRIDPRAGGGYRVPADNPFVGTPGTDEIYSYGLRNPYRFSFDGDRIAIGDVGQDSWEEIDYETLADARGANFGWNTYEGLAPDPCGTPPASGTTPPVHVYPHPTGAEVPLAGCAVTSGPIVRDERLPSLYGRYLYSDFCAGGLRSLVMTPGGGASDDREVGPRVAKLSSITTGHHGRIYMTSYLGNVYRLDPRRPAAASTARRAGGVRARRVGSFDEPVYVTGPPHSHGLLFVVEKSGVIKSMRRGGRPKTFLDIHGLVSDQGERGLLSVAFPRDYRQSRRFYVYYTDNDGDIVVAELRRSKRNARKANAKSRRTVIRIPHPGEDNHNGGQLQFGPDGYLYLGTGDGGGGGDPPENAQNRSSLLGKLLRIDPRKHGKRGYSVPRSNPFVGRAGQDQIYSYGLRNPYRFSFDRRNGRLAIGDVGQDRWEEIDLLGRKAARGANFGWDAFEGFERYRSSDASPVPPGPVTKPIAAFSHADGNCAITGGYVYRGKAVPKLRGRYVYADFCRGQIRSLNPAHPGRDHPVGIKQMNAISSFGEDARGNLYFTLLNEGGVYEIVGGRR